MILWSSELSGIFVDALPRSRQRLPYLPHTLSSSYLRVRVPYVPRYQYSIRVIQRSTLIALTSMYTALLVSTGRYLPSLEESMRCNSFLGA